MPRRDHRENFESVRDVEVAIRCFDVANRSRSLRVVSLPADMVALVLPPGEIAILAPANVVQLREALWAGVRAAAKAEDHYSAGDDDSVRCFHTTISCMDVVGRDRELIVSSVKGPLIELSSPAGEVAVLRPLKVGQLREALRTACAAALKRSGAVMQPASNALLAVQV